MLESCAEQAVPLKQTQEGKKNAKSTVDCRAHPALVSLPPGLPSCWVCCPWMWTCTKWTVSVFLPQISSRDWACCVYEGIT